MCASPITTDLCRHIDLLEAHIRSLAVASEDDATRAALEDIVQGIVELDQKLRGYGMGMRSDLDERLSIIQGEIEEGVCQSLGSRATACMICRRLYDANYFIVKEKWLVLGACCFSLFGFGAALLFVWLFFGKS
jgi:hypothetical protein